MSKPTIDETAPGPKPGMTPGASPGSEASAAATGVLPGAGPLSAAAAVTFGAEALRRALLDSRQRWRDLVDMAGDLAFETDMAGRLVFIAPDPALGWSARMLLGQPGDLLLADPGSGGSFSPFRPRAPIRRRRAWLKRADGEFACLSFAAAPLLDGNGRIIGARGVGCDVTEQELQEGQVAASLRRVELLDHLLDRMHQEVLASKMMQAVLEPLVSALGAEGVAVLDLFPGARGMVLHEAGGGVAAVLPSASELLASGGGAPATKLAPDGRPVLVCQSVTRFGGQSGLALWRTPGSRIWDAEEHALATSVASIIRIILEHEAVQREMTSQARTDPLTGLLNRRAFLEDLQRHIERLDRDDMPGTLMFIDLDNFKLLNDKLGHDAGDEALRTIANILRATFRPTDLVARLGGDEFAVWLNGADHMTAAERAYALCRTGMDELATLSNGQEPALSMSIGIATRDVGDGEPVESLLRRADKAMYEVKRSGRGSWHVSQERPV